MAWNSDGSRTTDGGAFPEQRAPLVAEPFALEARGISKRFGATQALLDVSLGLRPGSIHALLGRNGAGKSSLIGVLTGLTEPDAGEVKIHGEPAPPRSQPMRWRQKIGCVYQRPAMVPNLSVAENLYLNRYPDQRLGIISWRSLFREARKLLDEWEIDIDPFHDAAGLNVQERQQAEIACALATGTRILLLDEPTAELDGQEVSKLFERIHRLSRAGVSFLYISHHMEEIYELCDTASILRDGRLVISAPIAELPSDRLISAMVGDVHLPQVATIPSTTAVVSERPPALEVKGLSRAGIFDNVTFAVKAGECVGLAGLVASGRNAVAQAVAGLIAADSGVVAVGGTVVHPGDINAAINAGIGYLPEDRHAAGFIPDLSIETNLTMSSDRGATLGFVGNRQRVKLAVDLARELQVSASSLMQSVGSLSGGNQQKVALGRALATKPKMLVLAHPTSGVDIASKAALFAAIELNRSKGTGVLVVSDELDELAICSTIHVMFGGEIIKTFGSERSSAQVVAAMEGVEP